jgi:hypothetical protein
MVLCKKCGSRPIYVIKRGLCQYCYNKEYKESRRTPKPIQPEPTAFMTDPNHKEILFIKHYFTHQNWLYSPVTFHLGDKKYTPDFYDGNRQVFIEVVGSKQAFHSNKEKYSSLQQLASFFRFEIRDALGSLIEFQKDQRIAWPNGTPNNLADPDTPTQIEAPSCTP